jgi:2-phospho-L-lactate transferase/gluconeogenesis factor (CofD/UPF0052 family)
MLVYNCRFRRRLDAPDTTRSPSLTIRWVEQAGRFRRIRGRVYPAATEPVTLVVHHDGGSITPEEAAPVQIDSGQLKQQGARVHHAALLQDTTSAAVRHDVDRLARALHEVASVATRGR